MRTTIYSAAAVVAVAAAVFIWWKPVVVAPQVMSASVVTMRLGVNPSEAMPRIVPLEIMMQQEGKRLPVESWDAF
jgi:hypothetical protein